MQHLNEEDFVRSFLQYTFKGLSKAELDKIHSDAVAQQLLREAGKHLSEFNAVLKKVEKQTGKDFPRISISFDNNKG